MASPSNLKRFVGKWRIMDWGGHPVHFSQPFGTSLADDDLLLVYGVSAAGTLPCIAVLQVQANLQFLLPSRTTFTGGIRAPGYRLEGLAAEFDGAYQYLFSNGMIGSIVCDANGNPGFANFAWGTLYDTGGQPAFGYSDESGKLAGYTANVVTPALATIRKQGSVRNADFSFVDFNGEDLSGLLIPGANLAHATLARCKFRGTDLSGTDFTSVDLTQIDLSGAKLDGCVFSGLTLTRTVFSGDDRKASLRGAKFNSAANGTRTVLDNVRFTDLDLTGADFTGASLRGTDFRGATLAAVDFTACDLTVATFDRPPKFSHDQTAPMVFTGATVRFDVIGRDWRWFDLTQAEIVELPQTLSIASAPLQATGAKLTGLKNDLSGATLESAVFDDAVLDGLNLHGAHLDGASFVQARLHGTKFTSTVMKGVKLAGAQLGSQGLLFTLADGSADYNQLIDGLNNNKVAAVAQVLIRNGVQVGSVTVETVSATKPPSFWTVTDGQKTVYTVRLLNPAGQNALSVFNNSATHAELGDAYMPGADLTSANLYAVRASGIHLYGAGTVLDNAILEAADFSGANLGGASLKQAALYDAVFDAAVLTNTDFEGALLLQGQARRGVSLKGANLQSANFKGAKLYGASLQDAAVCMPMAGDPADSYGVWLGGVNAGDPLLATYQAELNGALSLAEVDVSCETYLQQSGPAAQGLATALAAASPPITISANAQVNIVDWQSAWQIADAGKTLLIIPGYDSDDTAAYAVIPSDPGIAPFTLPLADVQYFQSGAVAKPLAQDMQANGVTLSAAAQLSAAKRPDVWQIDDGAATYDLWEGYDLEHDSAPTRTVYARPAIPNVSALFRTKLGVTLQRTTITQGQAGQWVVDNDSVDAFNTALGYIVFNLVPAGTQGPLDIYGARLRIERLGDDNRLQYYDIVAGPTQIDASNFDPDTIYPNGSTETIIGNQLDPTWMRASSPPAPPTCVPSADNYCPQPSSAAQHAPRHTEVRQKPPHGD
ncbi:hypothetical protein BRAO375_3780014 [Bradyrhizobium sp. ORS 375]|uniref:pentapeptide repeat-containing protein n=1 Tax=Bradyrhizobium sp. (strain ORS 375) TaxID=566679 RepID=UPI0002406F43|nr:pentapeptide repeat-containing protein [Bradyrhizobium sp. ORS 375]CCD94899.1 hypothetical protein BRAO375_3780014 [Bradyrhizobium sp. ORS 375]